MDRDILDGVLRSVARSLGRKFVYARVSEGVKQHQAKRGLELLAAARLCHIVRHSAGSGLPLGAETKDRLRKAILVDIGVLHAMVGTPAAQAFPSWRDLTPALRGQMADQLAGQQLRLLDSGVGDGPELYYWQREGGRPGEIDYLIQLGARRVPIELKAGAAGAMKSLHQFVHDKGLDFAVRCDSNPPSVMQMDIKTTRGERVAYELVSLPLYLLWALPDLVAARGPAAP
jgi:predicted AAA+ superfamily ATPase